MFCGTSRFLSAVREGVPTIAHTAANAEHIAEIEVTRGLTLTHMPTLNDFIRKRDVLNSLKSAMASGDVVLVFNGHGTYGGFIVSMPEAGVKITDILFAPADLEALSEQYPESRVLLISDTCVGQTWIDLCNSNHRISLITNDFYGYWWCTEEYTADSDVAELVYHGTIGIDLFVGCLPLDDHFTERIRTAWNTIPWERIPSIPSVIKPSTPAAVRESAELLIIDNGISHFQGAFVPTGASTAMLDSIDAGTCVPADDPPIEQ